MSHPMPGTRVKHPRWDELHWAIGYIDGYGAVHGRLVFAGEDTPFHNGVKIKTWRWSKSEGFVATLATVPLDKEDWESVRNWLIRHGCLNDWELNEAETA